MAHRFPHSPIRVYCQSPTDIVSPPERRALLIGINYASADRTDEESSSYRPLKAPVNDAKAMKEVLIGGVFTSSLPFPAQYGHS